MERCVLALINEGARILGEGIASRALDVDMVYVFGYGFPAERGGPMFHAQRLGYARALERIERLECGPNGWAWRPAPWLISQASQAARR